MNVLNSKQFFSFGWLLISVRWTLLTKPDSFFLSIFYLNCALLDHIFLIWNNVYMDSVAFFFMCKLTLKSRWYWLKSPKTKPFWSQKNQLSLIEAKKMWNVVPPNAKILFAKIDSESMRFYLLQKFIFSENVFSLYKWVYYLLK